MNLYRIDQTHADSDRSLGPVTDIFGPRLVRSRAIADGLAIEAASTGVIATITRISGPGHVRAIGRVQPHSVIVNRVNR